MLDNIRSAFNVGSIFRTSEAARVARLELCGITPYPPNPRLERTALGTSWNVEWRHWIRTSDALADLRAAGVEIWALEVADSAVSLRTLQAPSTLALVFGHETIGVSPEVVRAADRVVQIPLHGRKNSLNVATAYGITVFEVLRQWGY
ncbi:MAG: TrmH family RNA methyltransferase [Candidatus Eisenbacteria bacterium]|nr:TrmH family RNA methyltransferase [Candidatus Eisenbacteria bacterium]MCC7143064.1 TrmH family RNA methyltransferase [Candidatus Eisenbacteria bacterium]